MRSGSTWKSRPLRDITDPVESRGLGVVERYQKLLRNMQWHQTMYAVMRADAVRRAGPLRPVWGFDIVFLAELVLLGAFAELPERLFFMRQNRPHEVDDFDAWSDRLLMDIDPDGYGRRSGLGATELQRELRNELFCAIRRAPAGRWEKARMLVGTAAIFDRRFGVRVAGVNWLRRRPTG